MVNTYAVQLGGCRFESLWGFGVFLKGAHYEVDYSGKQTYFAGLQCTLTSSCAKKKGTLSQFRKKHKMRILNSLTMLILSERGDPLRSFNIRKFSEKISQSRKWRGSHSAKKVESEILLLWNACKKISAYAPVRIRNLWVEKQASYH